MYLYLVSSTLSNPFILLTSTDDLLLRPPLPQDREHERQRVSNRHSQTQLRFPYQYEEPYAACDVEKQRNGVGGSAKHADNSVPYAEGFLLEPGVTGVREGWMLRRGVVPVRP